jgi:hypothetical protein
MIEDLLMDDRQLEVANWQTTLEKTFGGVRGNVGTMIQAMYETEAENMALTRQRCIGGMTLMQSFFDFASRTLAELRNHVAVLNVHNIAYNVATLRCMRAGWHEFELGYYFDGVRHLRAVFENTMYLGAVLRGLFCFDELHSFSRSLDLKTITPEALHKVQHKHVTAVSQRVSRLMYGEDSALHPDEQTQVRRFLAMQHMHVHRGESNVVNLIVDMIQHRQVPEITPEFDMRQASIFANTAACAAWTQHRVLQYLSEPAMNPSSWHEQWGVLDGAFRFWIDGWESPFARPMLTLADTSFTFNPEQALCQLRNTEAESWNS